MTAPCTGIRLQESFSLDWPPQCQPTQNENLIDSSLVSVCTDTVGGSSGVKV